VPFCFAQFPEAPDLRQHPGDFFPSCDITPGRLGRR
jgi:hypothetical protein